MSYRSSNKGIKGKIEKFKDDDTNNVSCVMENLIPNLFCNQMEEKSAM